MHPDEAVMLRGLPPVGRPEPVWGRLVECVCDDMRAQMRLEVKP